MAIEKYTFGLLSGAGPAEEAMPYFEDMVFVDSLENPLLGIYRRRVKDRLVFVGTDYDTLLANSAFGNAFEFLVNYDNTEVYRGNIRMGTSQVSFDEDLCLANATPDPVDKFYCLINSWEEPVNIITETKGGPAVTAKTIVGGFEYDYCEEEPCVGDACFEYVDCLSGDGWTVILHQVETWELAESEKKRTDYQREVITIDCLSGGGLPPPPGDGWSLVSDNCPTNVTYARGLSTSFNENLSFNLETPGVEQFLVWYYEAFYVDGLNEQSGTASEYDNGRLINNVLENSLPACISGGVISDFFSLNGDDTHPTNDVYDSAKLTLDNLAIWQKSDIKRGTAIQNATKGILTYKELLEILAEHFNLRIDVTDDGALRIEHVSYFDSIQGLDLTTIEGGFYLDATNKWQYSDENAYRRESWKFMEETSEAFVADPIRYDIPSYFPDELIHDMGRVNNDVGFVTTKQDKVADDGFVLAPLYVYGGNYSMLSHISAKTGDLLLNGYMSQPNLLDKFWRHDRLFSRGYMNEQLTDFETSYKRREQEEISIIMAPDQYWNQFNPAHLVKTGLGWGRVINAEYSISSCTLKLRIAHD